MESYEFELSSFYLQEDNIKEVRGLLEPVVKRTYEDPEFKAEFIADPLGVMKKEVTDDRDWNLPGRGELVVIDKTNPFSIYLTLPVNENMLELTDDELELVAGGGKFLGFINFGCKNTNCGKSCSGGGDDDGGDK